MEVQIKKNLQHRVFLILSFNYNQHVIRQRKAVKPCQICNAGILFLWVAGYEVRSYHAPLSFWHFHMAQSTTRACYKCYIALSSRT